MNVLVTIPEGSLRETLFPSERRERLESVADVEWNPKSEQFAPAELRDRLPGVEVCVTGWGCPKFDDTVLRNADALELVAHVGGSVGSIGSNDLYDRGIDVCSANAVLARYVAEGVLTYVLASLRDVSRFDAMLKAGGWEGDRTATETLFDATVGFVGLGDVGRHLLDLLAPFDVDVLLYDPYVSGEEVADYDAVELTDLKTTLGSSDVVSIHAPKTPETIRMIDRERLEQLRDDSLLINAARGAIIDEDALAAELRTGRISAVLDVYEQEPLPTESPLRSLENVTLLPHVAGTPARTRMPETIIDEVERFRAGESLEHAISRERFQTMTDDQLNVEDSA